MEARLCVTTCTGQQEDPFAHFLHAKRGSSGTAACTAALAACTAAAAETGAFASAARARARRRECLFPRPSQFASLDDFSPGDRSPDVEAAAAVDGTSSLSIDVAVVVSACTSSVIAPTAVADDVRGSPPRDGSVPPGSLELELEPPLFAMMVVLNTRTHTPLSLSRAKPVRFFPLSLSPR
jgi:hypothetical protein